MMFDQPFGTVIDRLGESILAAARHLGTGSAVTSMGAIEAHAVMVKESAEIIAAAIYDLATAVREKG